MKSPSAERDAWRRHWQEKDAALYDSGHATSGRLPAIRRLRDIAAPRLQLAGHITVEVGCGTGLFAMECQSRRVIGLDVSMSMLRVARSRMDRVCQQDLFHLGLKPKSVDSVVVAFVIDDYPPDQKRSVVRAARDLLRQDGHIFLAAYSPDDEHMGSADRTGLPVYLEHGDSYVNYLKAAGFTVQHEERIRTTGRPSSSDGVVKRELLVLAASA